MRRTNRNANPFNSFQNRLYEQIFGVADNITESYYNNGMNHNHSYDRSNHWEHYSGGVDSDEAIARSLQFQEIERSLQNMSINDEAIARQLQEMEDDLVNMSIGETNGIAAEYEGISRRGIPAMPGNEDNVDPDNMSYEQVTQLGESIGNVSTGLSQEQISRLPSHKITKSSSSRAGQSANEDRECAICKLEYGKGDVLITLPCAHKYHDDCIRGWLSENRTCCICKKEVTLS